MTWKFSERVSGIGLVLEIIFPNEHFLSSKKPGNQNKFVWKTWKSQGILFWNFMGHLDKTYNLKKIDRYIQNF